ncbi:MAG: DUF4349 domain-containing protein, partial [Flammeovirgaceae bacterium]
MQQPLLVAAFLTLLLACESQNISKSPQYKTIPEEIGDEKNKSRVVIYRARAELTVSNVDTVNYLLTHIAKKYDGYVVTLGSKQSSIRVKTIFLQKALDEVLRSGKVRRKIISGQDITEEYNDFTVRLENANKARQRYLE